MSIMDFSKASGNKLFKTVEKNNEEKLNVQKILNIPISQIDEDEINEETFHIDRVDGFAKAIKNMGFQGAITVYEKPDGRYKISSGHRRFRAMKELKKNTIPAIILKPVSRPEEVRNLVLSNTNNRVMTPLDWANAIDQYINGYLAPMNMLKNKKKDVARDLNLSETQVQRYLNVLKLIPELRTLCADENYPFTAIASASKLDEEQQRELYRIIINKSSNGENVYRDEVLEIIARMKNPEKYDAQNVVAEADSNLQKNVDFEYQDDNIETKEDVREVVHEYDEPEKSPGDFSEDLHQNQSNRHTESFNVDDELPVMEQRNIEKKEDHDDFGKEPTGDLIQNERELDADHNTLDHILLSIENVCKTQIMELHVKDKDQTLDQIRSIKGYLSDLEEKIKALK